MDFREPLYIETLAKYKSVTRAAEILGISQPTLSRCIIAAEERYGVRLFERLGKQLILTHAGQEYIKKGHEILSLGYQLQDMMRDLSNRDGGHIAVAITPSRGRYVLPNILPEFRMRYPDCEIEIYEGDVCQVEQLLEEGTANVGLFLRDPKREEYPKLKMEEICTEQVLLCVGRDSPYPAMGQWRKGFHYPWIDLNRLKGETFLVNSSSMRMGPLSHELFEQYDFRPKMIRTSDLDLNINLAAQGFGVCFCIEISADYCYSVHKPVFLSVGQTPQSFSFVAATHKDAYFSEQVNGLIHIVRQIFSKKR